jgi:hypothetical protein
VADHKGKTHSNCKVLGESFDEAQEPAATDQRAAQPDAPGHGIKEDTVAKSRGGKQGDPDI